MIEIVRNSYTAYLKNKAILRLGLTQTFDKGVYNYNIDALYYYWHPINRKHRASVIPIAERVGHTEGPFVCQKYEEGREW